MPSSVALTSRATSPAERPATLAVSSTSRFRSRRLIWLAPVVGTSSAIWRSGTIFGEPSALAWLLAIISALRSAMPVRASLGRRTRTS
ncbi:hypothetical protein D3C81_1126340 [compost metagenome]